MLLGVIIGGGVVFTSPWPAWSWPWWLIVLPMCFAAGLIAGLESRR